MATKKTKKKARPRAKTKTTRVSYKVRHGSPFREEDANVIGPELVRLAKENGGKITAKLVLDSASDPTSPLHEFFDWDDESAANKYRLTQARTIIKCIQYDVKGGEKVEFDVGVWERIVNAGELPEATPGPGYVTMATVAETPTFEKQILHNAWKDMRAWKARYNKYKDSLGPEMKGIFNAIARAEKTVPEKLEAG